MSVDFDHEDVELATGVSMHVALRRRPGAPRLVLLHGWPETWIAWRRLVEYLDDFDLVVPDLRGVGGTSVPDSGYDKKTMAGDIVALLDHLAPHPGPSYVVGHDWGGVVAFYVAHLMRERLNGLVMLDVTVPHTSVNAVSFNQGGKRWHHGFHRTQGLPETLITGNEAGYYGWFWDNFGATPDCIDQEARDQYLESYSQPARTRAGLELYRTMPIDEANATEVLDDPLPMPVLALGGAETWGRGDEPADVLRKFAKRVDGGSIPGAGHWLPEEAPADVAHQIRAFVARTASQEPLPT